MAQTRLSPQRAPQRRPAPRPAPLRVVRPDHRVRTVGALGSVFLLLVFAALFVVAGLHAVLVQTQAEIDSITTGNATLQEQRDLLLAELAWHDSPKDLETLASEAGLVLAADPAMLAPVPAGTLAAPDSTDPFSAGSAG